MATTILDRFLIEVARVNRPMNEKIRQLSYVTIEQVQTLHQYAKEL